MGKHNQQNPGGRGPSMDRASGGMSAGSFRTATLVGVAVLIGITGMNLYETKKHQEELNARLNQIDTRVTSLGTKIDAGARGQQQARQPGPDPDKVYTVKTEGSPFEGPKAAPVTIVEFSDFQ